jgi:hypothetical protein
MAGHPHKPGNVPHPLQLENRSATLGGQGSTPSVSDGMQPPPMHEWPLNVRLPLVWSMLWRGCATLRRKGCAPPKEGTRHVLPTDYRLDEAQSVAVFDDENHERREGVSQRAGRNEDTDSLSRPSSQVDRTVSVHNYPKRTFTRPTKHYSWGCSLGGRAPSRLCCPARQ